MPNLSRQNMIDRIEDVGPTPGEPTDALTSLFDAAIRDHQPVRHLLQRIDACSPYLRALIERDPERFKSLLESTPEATIDSAIMDALATRPDDLTQVKQRLRELKQRIALTIALADIGRVWPVMTVTDALSRFADAACQSALATAYHHAQNKLIRRKKLPAESEGIPLEQSGLFAIAMGKLGAGELNYSSDIDLIIFYDPDRQPDLSIDLHRERAIDTARGLVAILQEQTADGYVFRTDLRLRPDPRSTPVAMSTPAALEYYENFGQNWERAAYIKARPNAGDLTAGETFLDDLQPYIWRRHLDHAAIRDIHAMKRQIASHLADRENSMVTATIDQISGHNVKLGAGGIRTIEFAAQVKQLSAGGRAPQLRVRQTLRALDALADGGWMEREAAAHLADDYQYLRQVEHRLQMIADQQTHTVPETEQALTRLAWFCGHQTADIFADEVLSTLQRVIALDQQTAGTGDVADSLASELGSLSFTGTDHDEDTLRTLSAMGFDDPKKAIDLVRSWHVGRHRATRMEKARIVLTDLQPRLLEALAKTDTPDQALLVFDASVNTIANGVQFFAALADNPKLLELIAKICGTAPRLAEMVARHPHVLDTVLDPSIFADTSPDFPESDPHSGRNENGGAFEHELNATRAAVHELRFHASTQLLSGIESTQNAGERFADIADGAMKRLLKAARNDIERRHGRIPEASITLLAMGSWGAREMHAASDIDLILIYDTPQTSKHSDGARPLSPQDYFARLTKRFIAAVSSNLATGTAYEIDTRLRPSGNSGPLAVSLQAFEKYQRTEAWTWEHMALTRARPVCTFGSAASSDVSGLMEQILRSPSRSRDEIKRDIRDMRERLFSEKGASAPHDLRQRRGGLIDIQFLAQALTLIHAPRHPTLVGKNTVQTLQGLSAAGVLNKAETTDLLEAVRCLTAIIQLSKLCLLQDISVSAYPSSFAALVLDRIDAPDLTALQRRLDDLAAKTQAIFDRYLPLEPA